MKKFISISIVLVVTFGALGQHRVIVDGSHLDSEKNETTKTINDKSPTPVSRWYSIYETMIDTKKSNGQWVYGLHPDTTTRIYVNGKIFPSEVVSTGQSFDPASSIWTSGGSPFGISDLAAYTLDSVKLPYAYFRPQGGKADTLIIQIYKTSDMNYVSQSSSQYFQAYCEPGYNASKERGLNAEKTFEIVLDNSMVTGTGQWKNILLKVDIPIGAGEEVGLSMHFVPSNPVNAGDTVFQASGNEATSGSINGFVFRGLNATIPIPDRYNFSLDVLTEFGQGNYSGTTSFKFNAGVYNGNTPYQNDVWFKITSDKYAGIDQSSSQVSLKVYPNPGNGILYFEGMTEDLNYQVYDLVGKLQSSGLLSSASGKLDLRQLNKGQYLLHLGGMTELIWIE